MTDSSNSKLHIAMFPWFAFGHITPYLHLSNELAKRGHTVYFLLPKRAQSKFEHQNLYPNLIHFFPIVVPPIQGLPSHVETASDVPFPLHTHLATAYDQTRDQVQTTLKNLKPDFIFTDFAYWMSHLARPLGIKIVYYGVVCAAGHAHRIVPGMKMEKNMTLHQLTQNPPGFPSKMRFDDHLAEQSRMLAFEFGSDGLTLYDRLTTSIKESDAIAMRTCREIEGPFCDYLSEQYGKTMLLTGPVLPETQASELEEKWVNWLNKFEPASVVYCAFGSQNILEKDQFQELLLGFELSGQPFLVALKPPNGCTTVEEAFPEGFIERVGGKGWVCGDWVPQTSILAHPSVGCFASHCGFGSMWESLYSDCQIVLVPHLGDQIINAKVLAEELKVAMEVKREKNGYITREALSEAIKLVMDKDSEIGSVLKSNHAKCRDILSDKGMQNKYIENFIQHLQHLLK